jgi:D-alanyl-D-alanine carboxypeptidase
MARRLWLPVLFALVALLWGCGGDKPAGPDGSGEAAIDASLARALKATLDQQREFYELPGAAAAVVIPRKGMWSAGSGVADRKTGAPVTTRTPFAIASLTKPFIAALAVKLSESDRLRLDDKLSKFVPRWPNADRITVRQLLNHTSGVSSFDADLRDPIIRAIDARPRSYWSPQRTLSYAGKPSFEPGARWEYNGANYVLAGLVIERATHSTAARALREQILDPLGLDDVVLQPQERARGATAHGYGAIGHDRRERDLSDGTGLVPYRSVASSAWTSAGIVASAPSVARFGDVALFRGSFVTDDSHKQMLAFVPANGPYTGYGLGVGKGYSQQLSQPVWAAVGNFPGFGGILAHLPSKGVTVVVLANRDNATGITAAIADRLLEQATQPSRAG